MENDGDGGQALLEAVKTAAARSRWVFAATTLTCVLHLSGLWNAYLSWLRLYALGFAEPTQQPTSIAAQHLIRGWVDSTFLSVPILGFKVSAFDATVIGSLALLILVLWHFFSLRRENHLVAYVFNQAWGRGRARQNHVFAYVWSTQVFTTSRDDTPMSSVPAFDVSTTIVWGARGAVKGLMYLPAVTIAASLVAELCSMVVRSPFRPNAQTPAQSINIAGYVMIAAIIGVGLVIGTAVAFLCNKCVVYQNATGKLLEQAVSRAWNETPAAHSGDGSSLNPS
jgi:hypothetical protein